MFGCIDNVCTCQIRRNVFQYVYIFPDVTSTNSNWWQNHQFVIVFNKVMAWSQGLRDPSTAGFGKEAGLGQGSVVQTYPLPVLSSGKSSGIHCG